MVGRLQGKHEMCPLTLTEFKMGALKNCYLSFRKSIAYFSIKKNRGPLIWLDQFF